MDVDVHSLCNIAWRTPISFSPPLPSYSIAGVTRAQVNDCYTGDVHSNVADSMRRCDAKGPLMINIVKSYSTPDAQRFVVIF